MKDLPIAGALKGDYKISLASYRGLKSLDAFLSIDDRDGWSVSFVVTNSRSRTEIQQAEFGTLAGAIREYERT